MLPMESSHSVAAAIKLIAIGSPDLHLLKNIKNLVVYVHVRISEVAVQHIMSQNIYFVFLVQLLQHAYMI